MSISKKVALMCSVCGGTLFSYDEKKYNSLDNVEEYICAECNKVYTRDELKEAHMNKMEEELRKQAIEELRKEGFDIND